jgi:predicted house-cleaning NTP pyrophosphatase (Maf/HAM1 superfamily)
MDAGFDRIYLAIGRIEGSDTGIVGLPLCATGELLKAFGYVW